MELRFPTITNKFGGSEIMSVPDSHNNPLIVPIDVAAFCVGESDAQTQTSRLSGETLIYGNVLTPDMRDFYGSNQARDLHEPPWHPLEKGIHLHWALPDAFSRSNSNSDDETTVFPAVPTRWLVTRFLLRDGIISTRSHIVLSDQVSEKAPSSGYSVRHAHDTGEVRYIGKQEVLTVNWREPGARGSFRQWTKDSLTAASLNELAYTAYYPNCRSLFGFYDSLSDLQISNRKPVTVMYSVMGWYGNSAEDPLPAIINKKTLEEMWGWSFLDKDETEVPVSFLCHGTVQSITWHPDSTYLKALGPLQAEITVGGYPEEALSAFVSNKVNQGESAFFEKLTTAFQQDALDKFKKIELDQLLKLDQVLLQNEFHSVDSGSIYAIIRKNCSDSKLKLQTAEACSKPVELPLPFGSALNKLNKLRQQCDLCAAQLRKLREAVFTDWYRMIQADKATYLEALQILRSKIDTFKKVGNRYGSLTKSLQVKLNDLKESLGQDFELREEPAPNYWMPNDPAILLYGEDISPPSRYGGDHETSGTGYLTCRLSSQILTAVQLNGKVFNEETLPIIEMPEFANLPMNQTIRSLIVEACLLNTTVLNKLTSFAESDIWLELMQRWEDTTPEGKYPSSIAASRWEGANPWLPVFMSWTAEFTPLVAIDDGKYQYDYPVSYFTDRFRIDLEHGGIAVYNPQKPEEFMPKHPHVYRGWTLLSGYSDSDYMHNLVNNLDNILYEKQEDKALKKMLLGKKEIIVQDIAGFHEALLMRQHSKRLGLAKEHMYSDPHPDLLRDLPHILENESFMEPKLHYSFAPIRSGYLKVTVHIVDVFGQKRNVDNTKFIVPEAKRLLTPISPDTVFLPPRLADPARLLFRFIAADSKEMDEMNVHPSTTPICGWLVPSHLSSGIYVFNAKGKALGFLQLNGSKTELIWTPAPGDETTINMDIYQTLRNENSSLHTMLYDIYNTSIRQGTDYFIMLLKAIEAIQDNTLPGDTFTGMEAYVGQPIALVQCSLRLEVEGKAASNTNWKTVKTTHSETDNGYTHVKFPVRVGNMKQKLDGFIGFFKSREDAKSGYDFSRFFTEGCTQQSNIGVTLPTDQDLLLSITPKPNDHAHQNLVNHTQRVLMLIDPRTHIHASMGILPNKELSIPLYMYQDALKIMELSFLTTPVLTGCSDFELPLVPIPEYQWSWIEKQKSGSGSNSQYDWHVQSNIIPISGRTAWKYTPQSLNEGWLRLNPQLLEFRLSEDGDTGSSFTTNGKNVTMNLKVLNRKDRPTEWTQGKLVQEGDPNIGSVFYIHFGHLIEPDDVHDIQMNSSHFRFSKLVSPQYGPYWAATPKSDFLLHPASITNSVNQLTSLEILISNMTISSNKQQASVYFDYYNVRGLNDGVYADVVTIQTNNGA